MIFDFPACISRAIYSISYDFLIYCLEMVNGEKQQAVSVDWKFL